LKHASPPAIALRPRSSVYTLRPVPASSCLIFQSTRSISFGVFEPRSHSWHSVMIAFGRPALARGRAGVPFDGRGQGALFAGALRRSAS
jgi:hypothetical protein